MNAYSLEDDYNDSNKRNIRNTNKYEYNCGGYALGSFSWYRPTHDNTPVGRDYGATLFDCVAAMIDDFLNIRPIGEIKEIKENEYVVAFRLSNRDFHYIKRAHNGHWYHKMGSSHFIGTMKEEEVFSESWGHGYDGEIALLAVAR